MFISSAQSSPSIHNGTFLYFMYTACSVCAATPTLSVIPSTSDLSSVTALSVLVDILCGLLTVSIVVHIYSFIR